MVRFAVKIAGKTGKRKQRSGRGGAGIGFAARKHTEMGLRMQRSGQERAVVCFATQGKGDKQRRKNENRIRDARSLRSGWEDAGIRVAARKQAEMGLRIQRSGRWTTMVGVAA